MERNVIAVWGICNTASLNVYEVDEGEAMLVGINDSEPEWVKIKLATPDNQYYYYIMYGDVEYKLNECMRV